MKDAFAFGNGLLSLLKDMERFVFNTHELEMLQTFKTALSKRANGIKLFES